MKKFLYFLGVFLSAYLTTLVATRFLWDTACHKTIVRNAVMPDAHTIVVGASNGECSWDDSILVGSQNLSLAGRSYLSNLTTLRYVFDYNDHNVVDTVIVCSGFPSFFYYTDNVLNRIDRLISDETSSILSQKEFFEIHKGYSEYWKLILTRTPLLTSTKRPFGEFVHYDRDKLGDPRVWDVLNRQLNLVGGKDGLTESYIRKNCRIQVYGLKKIKEFCDDHHLVMVLYHAPLYRIPEYVNDKGYKDYLLSEFGDSLLISDYSHFRFPDTTYYSDLEHINYKGALMLSNQIKRNGLRLQYSIDYCKQ